MQKWFSDKLLPSLVVLLVLWQLFSLGYQPLPWFDEVVFASLGQQFYQFGTFHVPVIAIEDEVPLYGWVYFAGVGFLQDFLGESIFGFRLFNFLCGLGLLVFFFRLLPAQTPRWYWLLLFCADPFFSVSWHEGRMDITALSLCMVCFWLLKKSQELTKSCFFIVLSGLLAALALQVTPRCGFVLLGFVAFFFVNLKAKWNILIYWVIILVLIYSVWILIYFKSYITFWDYYTNSRAVMQKGSSFLSWFVGGELYVPKHEYLLLLLTAIASIFVIYKAFKSKILDENKAIFYCGWAVIALFYLLVKDYGPYSVFILPFLYLILAQTAIMLQAKRLVFILMLLLATHHAAYLGLRIVQLGLTWPLRQHENAFKLIKSTIPRGSRVIGDPLYYYAVRQAGSNYQLCDYYLTKPERLKYHLEKYNFQYLVVSKHLATYKGDIAQLYLQGADLELVAELDIKLPIRKETILSYLPISQTENYGYNAKIYKRINR
ncbi:MAG: hypothetical protein EAZ57_10250 [Cytophagales bacterium]|nr:MAG: hypothetical protein EAZ67_06040 [Cytophagales bacterium]TAF59714.1 MAG: hypothetical protein EAZ57_10250 [Cytophagales bacterium]